MSPVSSRLSGPTDTRSTQEASLPSPRRNSAGCSTAKRTAPDHHSEPATHGRLRAWRSGSPERMKRGRIVRVMWVLPPLWSRSSCEINRPSMRPMPRAVRNGSRGPACPSPALSCASLSAAGAGAGCRENGWPLSSVRYCIHIQYPSSSAESSLLRRVSPVRRRSCFRRWPERVRTGRLPLPSPTDPGVPAGAARS